MKTCSVWTLLFVIGALAAPLGLMAAPKEKPAEEAPSDEKDGKKNTTVIVLAATMDRVHGAALEALAAIGCKVKSDNPSQIEGKRSNKVGLAVGSGGEKLFVTMKDLGEGKTELNVVTKKTMVGILGQKLWNDEVAEHVQNALK